MIMSVIRLRSVYLVEGSIVDIDIGSTLKKGHSGASWQSQAQVSVLRRVTRIVLC